MNRRKILISDPKRGTKRGPLLVKIPPFPTQLNDVGRVYWTKVCTDLRDDRRLTSYVLETVAAYCSVLSDIHRARVEMNRAINPGDLNQWRKHFNDSSKIMVLYLRELGLSPTSASKVVFPEKETEDLEFDLN